MKNSLSLLVLLSFVLVSYVQSFSAGPAGPAGGAADTSSCSASTNTAEHASSTGGAAVDRRSAITSLASSMFAAGVTAAVSGPSSPAYAAEVDPAVKGTKKDPAYEACVSQCLYECTKPKGDEQKSRAECIPECKKKCATTKEQLMKGTPVKKEE